MKSTTPFSHATKVLLLLAFAVAACGDDDDGGASGRGGGTGQSGTSGGGPAGGGGPGGAGGGGTSGAGGGAGSAGSGNDAGTSGAGSGGDAGTGGSAGSAGGGQSGAAGGGQSGAAGSAGGTSSPLDPSFGEGGILALKKLLPNLGALAYTSVGADGRIDLIAVDQLGVPIVIRLLADGQLDPSFGEGGVLYVELPPNFFGYSSTTQPDGKIVLGGADINELQTRPGLLRLNADGAPDLGFGDGGYIAPSLPDTAADASALAVHEGAIFVVGTGGGSFDIKGTAVRVRADGSLDTTFHAPDGYHVYEPFDSAYSYSYIHAAHVAPDGSSYSCGNTLGPSGYEFLALRYAPDGTPDPSFRDVGALHLLHQPMHGAFQLIDSFCRAIAEAPDGKVVFGGLTQSQEHSILSEFVLMRTLHDGTLDPSFGEGGMVTMQRYDAFALTDLSVRPDGSIVAAGYTGDFDALAPIVVRLRPDGTPDPAFGDEGSFLLAPLGPGPGPEAYEITVAVKAQPDGKLIVSSTSREPILARLLAP